MALGSMKSSLVEDHRDAYFFWRSLGLQGVTCIHVDAHLDVSDLKTPSNDLLKSPEINCGNYLLPCLIEGIVERLIWVVPPHLNGDEDLLSWVRRELQNWVHLTVGEYMNLESDDFGVAGTLMGKPFQVCYSTSLPPIHEPHVLDIDVDYYLAPDDSLWQEPGELAQHLKTLEPLALTVAYSVQGGYTPLQHRVLGPMTVQAFDSSENFSNQLEAARLFQEGRKTEAIELDEGYREFGVDKVSAFLLRENFEAARGTLGEVEDELERLYLEGMICFKTGQYKRAGDAWSRILGEATLGSRTRLFLLLFLGRARLEAEQGEAALRAFQEALTMAPRDSECLYLAARARVACQELTEAARLYRKAIRKAPDRLETAEITLELVEVYLRLGQTALARSLLRRTLQARMPGFIKLRAEALTLKAALGNSVEGTESSKR